MSSQKERWTGLAVAGLVALFAAAAPGRGAAEEPAPSDSSYTIKGGQDRTDLKSLTVEGEDRVHVTVERPALTFALDPAKVEGLVTGDARDVLDRVPPDLTSAYVASSAQERTPYTGRPWLGQFASGAVARFHPDVKGTERWKLVVADSRGQVVRTYEGKGSPPKEIVWDGRATDGTFVTPGVTYSYVFEAKDKAGNKRNFVGDGFRVSAYRLETPEGPALVFSGLELRESGGSLYGSPKAPRGTAPLLLEAASWLNQSPSVTRTVRVTTVGRSQEQAATLAKQVAAAIAQHTIGDPARIQTLPQVAADAPDGGTVRIALAGGPAIPTASAPQAVSEKKDEKKKKDEKPKKAKK